MNITVRITSLISFMCIGCVFLRCNAEEQQTISHTEHETTSSVCVETDTLPAYYTFLKFNPEFKANGFDYPVGAPNAKNYYNAQPFGKNHHLGDDWNGLGGGDSDLGDPVYAAGNGYVSEVYDAGTGWGNVVRIIHQVSDSSFVETLYAHLDTMEVTEGDGILKGAQLGTIGNANGAYLAHLHFELRNTVLMGLNGGYSEDTTGYADPTRFINENRRVMWKLAPAPIEN